MGGELIGGLGWVSRGIFFAETRGRGRSGGSVLGGSQQLGKILIAIAPIFSAAIFCGNRVAAVLAVFLAAAVAAEIVDREVVAGTGVVVTGVVATTLLMTILVVTMFLVTIVGVSVLARLGGHVVWLAG